MADGTNPYQVGVEATYGDLARWQARARKQPSERPQRGSELDLDDRVFPHHPVSEVARISLIAAGEHLRLARDALQAGEGYPSAHFTVLRSAFVGAAQGVWVLSPEDRKTRRARGLTVVAEIYHQLGIYYGEVGRSTLGQEQGRDLREQQEWLTDRKEALAAVRPNASQLDLTNAVIPQALDHRFQDSERRQHGRQLWRQMSADSHVLGWSMFQRSSFAKPDKLTGLADGGAVASWRNISQPFVASHKLLQEGWSLFDRRCEAP